MKESQLLGFNGNLVLDNPAKKSFPLLSRISQHMLPSLFIVGAQKGGTTSLGKWLVSHPNIVAPKMKETFFFNDINNYKKGIDWYKCHFPTKSIISNAHTKVTFDASANYLESKDSVQRIKQHFPDAKIVILLRNPIDRAYSHYQMAKSRKFELLSFEEALRLEDERILLGDRLKNQYGHNYMYQKLGYREKGLYVDFVREWLLEFPKNQLLFIDSEGLFTKSDEVYRQVLNFLDLEYSDLPVSKIHNQQSYEPMLKETRTELHEFYAPSNERLYKLLGRSFNWS